MSHLGEKKNPLLLKMVDTMLLIMADVYVCAHNDATRATVWKEDGQRNQGRKNHRLETYILIR